VSTVSILEVAGSILEHATSC